MRTLTAIGLMIFIAGLCACAQTRDLKTSVYSDRNMDITLNREMGPDALTVAKGHSHPADFQVEELKYMLQSIRYREKGLFGWSDTRRIFALSEIHVMAPHLIEAFARATPDDEVAFSSMAAKSGTLFSSARFTNGVMFVSDGKLNCIFGNINIKPDDEFEDYDLDPRREYGGALAKLVTNDWQGLVEGAKGIHYNWVEIDIEAALSGKTHNEEALKRRVERRQRRQEKRLRESVDWEEWESDEAIPLDEDFEEFPAEP